MSFADEPSALKDPAERRRRSAMLSLPHMQPLVDYVERMRLAQGPGFDMPSFDPCDGGVRARVLFLLEAPGPKAVGSSFISCNNPDQTARNMNQLLRTAGLQREDVLLWNIVPWYVGSGQKIRPVDREDIAEAAPYLRELIGLLPNLRGIVLVGKKAQSARAVVRRLTSVKIFEAHHPSPQVFNVWPEKREEAQAVFNDVRRFLELPAPPGPARVEPADGFVALSLEAALTVSDLAASVAWYTEVVGFSVGQEHRREGRLLAVSLRAGAVRILLNQDDGARGTDRPRGEGFSLQFTTPQDVDAIAARVRARGGVLALEPTDGWGARVFRLLDPDGFRLTISSPRAE